MNAEYSTASILSDYSSHIDAGAGGFPIDAKDSQVVWDEHIAGNYHWHRDLQFVYLESGTLEYFINGQSVEIKAGQLLFINSSRLHYITSDRSYDTRFEALRIHPCIFSLESRQGMSYFERKFGLNNLDYMILDPESDWCVRSIELVKQIISNMDTIEENPLPILYNALCLIELVGSHIDDMPIEPNTNQDQLIFLNMAQFIRENHMNKLRIEDISNVGHVSRAKTYNLFDKYAHMSPNTYIMNYRISRSTVLLRDTNLSIAEISTLCGFQSSSYFTSVFSKEKGMTPREYRAHIKDLVTGGK